MSTPWRVSGVIMVWACIAGAMTVRLALPPPAGFWLPVVAVGLAAWIATGLLNAPPPRDDVVLRLWGLEWKRDEACCHFFITGSTGTGKTARAVSPSFTACAPRFHPPASLPWIPRAPSGNRFPKSPTLSGRKMPCA
ncbi:hypothetical protein Ga0100231_000100 [Opitutaceae bacterium TAV4]|nr:hypothetical protein Ga0100231_000100 [Opitutaceae bacterium TAV4]RRK01686.1 hypothetical protein Ga0100230_007665 [Opitutaceae bacterium TAV3]